jgi:hypothetical protein
MATSNPSPPLLSLAVISWLFRSQTMTSPLTSPAATRRPSALTTGRVRIWRTQGLKASSWLLDCQSNTEGARLSSPATRILRLSGLNEAPINCPYLLRLVRLSSLH